LISIIMAGGRGSRLGYMEKPMIKLCDRYIIENIFNAVSRITDKVYVAVSEYTPKTTKWCEINKIPVIKTGGEGYVNDLRYILKRFERPILILPSDTPFLTTDMLKEFISKASKKHADVVTLVVERHCFPRRLRCYGKESIGISLFKGYKNRWENIKTCRFPDLLDIDTIYELNYAMMICDENPWRKFIK